MIVHIVRQPQRARSQRIVEQFGHYLDFRGRRGAIPGFHAHRGQPQRDMPDVARKIERNLDIAFERFAIFGPFEPIPRHILLERPERDVFEE